MACSTLKYDMQKQNKCNTYAMRDCVCMYHIIRLSCNGIVIYDTVSFILLSKIVKKNGTIV